MNPGHVRDHRLHQRLEAAMERVAEVKLMSVPLGLDPQR